MHLEIFKQSKQIIESNALRKSKKLKNILVSCQCLLGDRVLCIDVDNKSSF